MPRVIAALPLGQWPDPEPLPALRDPTRRAQALSALAGLTVTRLLTPPSDARARAVELRRCAGLARCIAAACDAEAAELPQPEWT